MNNLKTTIRSPWTVTFSWHLGGNFPERGSIFHRRMFRGCPGKSPVWNVRGGFFWGGMWREREFCTGNVPGNVRWNCPGWISVSHAGLQVSYGVAVTTWSSKVNTQTRTQTDRQTALDGLKIISCPWDLAWAPMPLTADSWQSKPLRQHHTNMSTGWHGDQRCFSEHRSTVRARLWKPLKTIHDGTVDVFVVVDVVLVIWQQNTNTDERYYVRSKTHTSHGTSVLTAKVVVN